MADSVWVAKHNLNIKIWQEERTVTKENTLLY